MKIILMSFILVILGISFIHSPLLANALNIGDDVPSFKANDNKGNLWKLEDHLNQKYLIVYFYPAALTGG